MELLSKPDDIMIEELSTLQSKLRSLLPQKLKYRLFAAFLFLILVPFSVLNIYNYQQLETVMQQKISEKSLDQLQSTISSLDSLMNMAFQTWIMLEQDAGVRQVLLHPEQGSVLDNKHTMEAKFIGINNSLFLMNPVVYYTILDLHGNIYTSFQPRKALDYEQFKQESWYRETLSNRGKAGWVTDDDNYVSSDLSTSKHLLTMYTLFRDKDRAYAPYGVARISIDYNYWFKAVTSQTMPNHDYLLLAGDGEQVAQSRADLQLSEAAAAQIVGQRGDGYFIDHESSAIVNYSYIDSLDWYIVNRTPRDVLFRDVYALKRNFFVTVSALMALFVIITFMISSTITKPLSHLQAKMMDAVRKNLKIRLPQSKYRGEIQDLTKTFNMMLDDMNGLIRRLKEEERQKEAVRFQMLLAQVNPHFLLNTLNTMKWIAIRNRNDDIEEICISLGKLLEVSLNSGVDMIHLEDEMELVRSYLRIQQKRFHYQLDIALDYDESVAYALVPKLSIQPLVENAFQHGIAHIEGQGKLAIVVSRPDRNQLEIKVKDNGAGLEAARQRPQTRQGNGIGIQNLRERLALLFKGAGSVELLALEGETVAVIRIPLLLAKPYHLKTEADWSG